jgi:hypothetical protein
VVESGREQVEKVSGWFVLALLGSNLKQFRFFKGRQSLVCVLIHSD